MKIRYLLILCVSAVFVHIATAKNYEEQNGLIVIEAEDFTAQAKDDTRRWLRFDRQTPAHRYPDADPLHLKDASNGSYLEILPDTRTNHSEPLIKGENFSDKPGVLAILAYPVFISTPGRYYVWARSFSTGPEDNGVHIGINGRWPESGQRLQFCKDKHQWTWSSAQRRPESHCGSPRTVWLDIAESGMHNILVSMREDGFELDKLILARDVKYEPKGQGPKITLSKQPPLMEKKHFIGIDSYSLIINATTDFKFDKKAKTPFYIDHRRSALAVNAAKKHYRDQFAKASFTYTKKNPIRNDVVLVTLTETDGESEYRVQLNDKTIGEFKNPESDKDYQEMYFRIPEVEIKKGDVLTVESKAVTNGKIPEKGGTAYSRGRWRGVVLTKSQQKN